jgi:hypothetical protein
MTCESNTIRREVDGVAWEIRPEWLAGRYWWRIYVSGHTKLLVRFQENAIAVATALATDEAEFRREGSTTQ